MASRRPWQPEGGRFGPPTMRFQRMSMRFWIAVMAAVFLVALLLAGHQTGHVPSISSLVGHGKSEPDKPKPPPYPKPAAPGQMIQWEPPKMDALIHGVHASEGSRRKPEYPLLPFPDSPMTNPPEGFDDMSIDKPWLGAVICPAWDIKRRMLIRYTWMKMFKDVPMDQRFVVSNPGPQWTDIVSQENKTFGDMIVLDHLQEDDFTANTVKTVEFYRWLADKSPRKYAFVSKMDTDLFVNARGMWDRKILPRLVEDPASGRLVPAVNHTVIGQFYFDAYHKTSFPHGAIYTVTWDVVTLLPKLQDKHHIIAGEDVTMAWLLMLGHQKLTFAVLSEAEKFEFDAKDTRPGERTAWARNSTDVTAMWHALAGQDVLAIHQLKKDDEWLMVADCFDEKGIRPAPTEPEKPPPRDEDKPRYPRPFHHEIPPRYWETDADGALLCNGVWKLEPGVGRDMKMKGGGSR